MKESSIDYMIPRKKYVFTMLFDDKTEFFTAYFDKYDGNGWIKIYDARSFITKEKLDFAYITNFQAYELKETYVDMTLRYLYIKRGSRINIYLNSIIRPTVYTSIFSVGIYIWYKYYRDSLKYIKHISKILK